MILLLFASLYGYAEGEAITDTVLIYFPQSKWTLNSNFGKNSIALNNIQNRLTNISGDSIYRINKINIIGGASPEGSVLFNQGLSKKRAEAILEHVSRFSAIDKFQETYTYIGRDWEGVLKYALLDENLPFKGETIALLKSIIKEKQLAGEDNNRYLTSLQNLRRGVPYKYLYTNIFPKVRTTSVIIEYCLLQASSKCKEEHVDTMPHSIIEITGIDNPLEKGKCSQEEIALNNDTIVFQCNPSIHKFFMDIHTNMLYDALIMPNIGVEFYLGKNFSVNANWLYAWWSKNISHYFWRAYGGEISGRYWFGKKAHIKPLTGHHTGILAQFYTYDFEFGQRGEMGGRPGGNIWNQSLWTVGIDYGYALPVARRLNIDFSVGIGYSQGYFHKYHPIENHYVWESTHLRKYFGPIKLDVALIWLIGNGNYNKKGGEK